MTATLKVHKLHAQNVDVRLVKGFHEHYQVLPRAMGPSNLLENIAELPDRQVTKTGKSLSSDFLSSVSVTVRQASTITEAITTKKSRKIS